VVNRLLQEDCDVNARNEDGMNALMLGSQRGHADIVDLLIRHNAIIDCRTVQGYDINYPICIQSLFFLYIAVIFLNMPHF
jgi:ankyrin repeat protein